MPSRADTFTTIRIEGAILPADLLQRIADGDKTLGGLTSDDYHLPGREKLNEATNSIWNRMRGAWIVFKSAVAKLPEGDMGTTVARERWLLPFFQDLGYGRLVGAKAIEVKGKTYPISHYWEHTPIHLVGCRVGLDAKKAGVAGAARSSPHSLVQEFLNSSDDHLWGFVSNGLKLRILRDNVSLTRQAYVEFDLETMMDGEVYADFVLLWLLCHQSRVEAKRPEECWLERWSKAAQEQGTRALEDLRGGVERAIAAFGRGFLAHPANRTLRDKLQRGDLSAQDFYRQILRLVYRLLFLFVAEDRDLLVTPYAESAVRRRYSQFYSLSRLRRLAERRRGTRHFDLFHGLRLIMQKLGGDTGCKELGLPALGSFLFSKEAILDLNGCELANYDLLEAVRALAFLTDGHNRRSINYKNLRSEELGSVYESLLELHPTLNVDAATFELTTAGGHERKTTGSYYTPDSLVVCLLDSALDPVLDEACRKPKPEAAILQLKICDPACGSGHFLIAAAHRVAKRLASIRTGDEEPSPEATRKALRDVIGHCVYGVDQNPMAVELCKVALWMEALEPGKPLSFLDHRIQCGNSLLGATPALLKNGIPDEAFKEIEGDDKEVCKEYKKQNKEERKGVRSLFDAAAQPWERLGNLASSMMSLDTIVDDTIEGVKRKQEQYEDLVKSSSYLYGRLWADAWCAAFVWKKTKDFPYPITEEVFRKIEENPDSIAPWLRDEIQRLAQKYQFFHWHLAFPDVFRVPGKDEKPENDQAGWSRGFDVVLGNPPWDQMQFRLQEFFADKAPSIAAAATEAVRTKLIAALYDTDPALFTEYLDEVRKNEGTRLFAITSGRFPHSARGRVNTYLLFTELASQLSRHSAGLIVPSGVATDESGRLLFAHLLRAGRIRSVWDFENRERLFAEVHSAARFALLSISPSSSTEADFCFGLHNLDDAREQDRHFRLSLNDLTLLNPNTLTCPSFSNQRDSVLVLAVHRRLPILMAEVVPAVSADTWGLVTKPGLLNMATDSSLFVTAAHEETLFPVYEGKMFSFYDHRYADVVLSATAQIRQGQSEDLSEVDHMDPARRARPRHWIRSEEIERRIRGQWERGWIPGWKEITSPTNARTLIPAILPLAGIGHKIPVFLPEARVRNLGFALVANLGAFVCDFICRNKLNGTSLTPFTFKQLPALSPSKYTTDIPWASRTSLQNWLLPRVLELTYTAWDLEPFAQDCCWSGPPFRWDEERRFLLRCELDAAFFHLYLSAETNGDWRPAERETAEELARLKASFPTPRDAMAYIMDTFPIVRRRDEEKYDGDYRTKRVILEIYDVIAEAIRTGKPYQTKLDPPPGPPATGLPPWPAGAPKPANWAPHIHPPHRS